MNHRGYGHTSPVTASQRCTGWSLVDAAKQQVAASAFCCGLNVRIQGHPKMLISWTGVWKQIQQTMLMVTNWCFKPPKNVLCQHIGRTWLLTLEFKQHPHSLKCDAWSTLLLKTLTLESTLYAQIWQSTKAFPMTYLVLQISEFKLHVSRHLRQACKDTSRSRKLSPLLAPLWQLKMNLPLPHYPSESHKVDECMSLVFCWYLLQFKSKPF